MKSAIISTYPRSGKTYFTYCFNLNFLEEIPYTHLYTEQESVLDMYDEVITIVRNPKDAIVSFITMEIYYFDSIKKIYEEDKDLFVKEYIQNRIEEYYSFHQTMLKRATMIIDFEYLKNNPSSVMIDVGKKLNIELKNNIFKDLVIDNKKLKFLKTSKSSNIYNDIEFIVSNMNLEKCLNIYKLLLNKR
jgi:hypothetical protein